PNPIAAETLCPGSDAWHLDHSIGGIDAIEGFTAPATVNAGQEVHLYVSTTAVAFTFTVYRMGYYQGHGARLMYSSRLITGVTQPAAIVDPTTRMVSAANWRITTTIHTGATWVSGVYIVKLLSSAGFMRYTIFVVRSDSSAAPIVVQIPFFTYQAYNRWGDHSLYRGLAPDGAYTFPYRSYAASFDRPYDLNAGLGDFSMYDVELVSWLEQQSYDVTYMTDSDLDLGTTALVHRKLVIVSGHSEYWSTQMRHNITATRDAGTSLAFFGGNDVYWHIRLLNSALGSDRVVVCYKSATLDPVAQSNPLATTVRWEDPPLHDPEVGLLGLEYGGGVATTTAGELASGSQPFLQNTTLQVGDAIPGVIGGEYDRQAKTGAPATLQVIMTSPLQCKATSQCPASGMDFANASVYQAPSGAKVFDAGTFQWSWGLSDLRIDQLAVSGSGDSGAPGGAQSGAIRGATGQTASGNEALLVTQAPPLFSNPHFQTLTVNILAYLMA
ncbi:MAG: N,N-dimethylformamidase beta subunit family domain-containing protein, partial [Ktedonobacterales bacterium]